MPRGARLRSRLAWGAIAATLPVLAAAQAGVARGPADRPVERRDRQSQLAHLELLEKTRRGRVDVYFVGDSIARRWGATDYPDLLAHWRETFFGWNAGNFAWGGDGVEHILWRLQNGELENVSPRVFVVLAGTNNVGNIVPPEGIEARADDIARGLRAVVETIRSKHPQATVILTAIFPRNDNMAVLPVIRRVNAALASFADGRQVRYLDVNDRLANEAGVLVDGMMHDGLHPTRAGYQVWADALKPILTELLGPPAAVDQAPPPTGVPTGK